LSGSWSEREDRGESSGMQRRLRAGFTLIELLIVIAIILILIAIALPNFLEAQIRAKVSQVRGNLRTLQIALEMYATDNQGGYEASDGFGYYEWGPYPPSNFHRGLPGAPRAYNCSYEYALGCFAPLTTPHPYLTDIDAISDAFGGYGDNRGVPGGGRERNRFGYATPTSPNYMARYCAYTSPYPPVCPLLPTQTGIPNPSRRGGGGSYHLFSVGPDGCAAFGSDEPDCAPDRSLASQYWEYGPTNGSRSYGDLNLIGP
jgi:prepilin-type N-terminal cleavage/methylation domain-containing protein